MSDASLDATLRFLANDVRDYLVIGYFRALDDWIPWHSPDGRAPTHWMPLPPGPEGVG